MIFKAINLDKIIKGPVQIYVKESECKAKKRASKKRKKTDGYVAMEDEFKIYDWSNNWSKAADK